jgi:hypothetical protein
MGEPGILRAMKSGILFEGINYQLNIPLLPNMLIWYADLYTYGIESNIYVPIFMLCRRTVTMRIR